MIELEAGKYGRRDRTAERRKSDRFSHDDIETNSYIAAATMVRLSNYQNDPMAATLGSRSLGLAKLNVTKEQLEKDRELIKRKRRVDKIDDRDLLIDARSEASRVGAIHKIGPLGTVMPKLSEIEQALYRKKISDDYHTSLPKFLRSQGPFAVYDHSMHKGIGSSETVAGANELALQRYN